MSNTYAWLIRREFWENRAIWMIPAVVGAFLILAALFGRVDLMAIPAQVPARTVGQMFLTTVGATFFAVMSVYSTWYLLDCLYADRKDRSVLFWKSLPISDTTTVMSKLVTAMLVIPLVYFAAADLTTLMMAFIISVRDRAFIGGALWHGDLWLQMQALWLYVIVTAALWYLPIAGYLLIVSAWAKRAVTLWSILPPIAAILIEHWFFGTRVIADQFWARTVGWLGLAFHLTPGSGWQTTIVENQALQTPKSVWNFIDAAGFFSSPETWIGAAVGVALIACAVQLRTRRAEI
jgi:ABC-2 type transport system permease protein